MAWVRHPLQNRSGCYKAMAEALSLRNWAQSLMHPVMVPGLSLKVTREEEENQTQPNQAMNESMKP